MKRPGEIWLLAGLLAFLGLGGIYGGISMLIDPTGNVLQMESVLPQLPVPDLILPGFFLLTVMGFFPGILTWGLIRRPGWAWADRLSSWSRHHWAWTGTVAVGITLIVWLAVQAALIGFHWPIQFITLADGILILILAFTPRIRRHYSSR